MRVACREKRHVARTPPLTPAPREPRLPRGVTSFSGGSDHSVLSAVSRNTSSRFASQTGMSLGTREVIRCQIIGQPGPQAMNFLLETLDKHPDNDAFLAALAS